jgi:Kef-type K+ transport system membrane component KefB
MDALLLTVFMLLAGYLAGALAARLHFPRITGYLIAGMFLNPSVLHAIPQAAVDKLNFIITVVLGVVSYVIGGGLRLDTIRKLGKAIVSITIFQGLMPFLLSALLVAGLGPFVLPISGGMLATFAPMALVLGAIAVSSAPAAVVAIVHECRATGPVTTTCLAVLALTDAFTVIAFACSLDIGRALAKGQQIAELGNMLAVPVLHVMGSVVAGAAFGWLLLKGLERIRAAWGLLATISAGIIILTAATETWGLSSILANMASGFVVANRSGREEMLTVLERIEETLFVLFFVLSGMYVDIAALNAAGVLVVLIMLGRMVGKYAGARIGAALVGAPESLRKYPGFVLLPKAGLTLGLAFLARQAFPSFGPILFDALLASTVINMLLTPPLAKLALVRSGESGFRAAHEVK